MQNRGLCKRFGGFLQKKEYLYRKEAAGCGLTKGQHSVIISIEKGTATSGWSLSNESSYLSPKNRHLAEWRFLFFTTENDKKQVHRTKSGVLAFLLVCLYVDFSANAQHQHPNRYPLQLGIKSHMQSLDQFVFQVAAAEDDQPQKCDDAQNQADDPGDAVGIQLTVVINAEEQ